MQKLKKLYTVQRQKICEDAENAENETNAKNAEKLKEGRKGGNCKISNMRKGCQESKECHQ